MKISQLRQIIREETKSILSERFLNLFKREEIEPYIDVIWDMMERTYEPIGGFKSARSKEDLLNKTFFAKLVRRNNKIVAAALYKDKYGRKAIAKGSDGSSEGIAAVKEIYRDDVKFDRSWGEFFGKPESLLLQYGGVPIPNSLAGEILGKPILKLNPNGYHYTRMIDGEPHEKILIGNPKR
jgi:hypothetical protein